MKLSVLTVVHSVQDRSSFDGVSERKRYAIPFYWKVAEVCCARFSLAFVYIE